MKHCMIVFTIFILVISPMKSQDNFSVQWKIVSNPVVFGDAVRLLCTVTGIEQCKENFTRTWTHGTNDDLIFNNGRLNQKIADETKYVENVSNPCQSFSLTITNFNESDAVDTYSCSLTVGTHMARDRKTISLNETIYEFLPTSDLIQSELTRASGMFNYSVKIQKVHPLPVCTAFYKHNPLFLTTKYFNAGLFYDVCIIINGSVDYMFWSCDIGIICKIGNQDVNIGDIIDPGCVKKNADNTQLVKIYPGLWRLWIMLIVYQLSQELWTDRVRSGNVSTWKTVVIGAIYVSLLVVYWKFDDLKLDDSYFTLDGVLKRKLCVMVINIILFLMNNRKILKGEISEFMKQIMRYVSTMLLLLAVISYMRYLVLTTDSSYYIDIIILFCTMASTGGLLMFVEGKKKKKDEGNITTGNFKTVSGGLSESGKQEWNLSIEPFKSSRDDIASEDGSFETASDGWSDSCKQEWIPSFKRFKSSRYDIVSEAGTFETASAGWSDSDNQEWINLPFKHIKSSAEDIAGEDDSFDTANIGCDTDSCSSETDLLINKRQHYKKT